MHFYTKFYCNILKYDLINVYNLKLNSNLPKLKTIIVNLKLKTCDTKKISASLLALELITQQWSQFMSAWKSKISLKIRKGSAIGCKLIIKKRNMFAFFNKTMFEMISKSSTEKIQNYSTLQFTIKNVFNINELKNHYNFFNNLSSLKIILLIDYNNKNLTFFFKSLTNYLILKI